MPSNPLVLTPINGELRVHDLVLADRLCFEHPLNIRNIIKRNQSKLLKFGVLSTMEKTSGELGGRPTSEFYLNQKQAIFICMKSETDKAFDVQVEIVRVFDAYLNGELKHEQPVPHPTLTAAQLQAIKIKVHQIGNHCHFSGRAREAVYERLRFQLGLRGISELPPDRFEEAITEIEGLATLAEQHFQRMVTLDEEFITAVLRPPVSIRKVRAMAKKQAQQPPLQY